ncbi:cytidine deaminase-like protein [Rhizophagus diaphanus]|nr:cytidine deaminase-like protein [Rhizophagus diaphanus] [Rhizophagus sp. MUCL 43196]
MSHHAPNIHRSRKAPQEEEDAAKLKFGEDFEDEEFLFISEVALLLEKIPDSQKNNTVYKKTEELVNTFTRFHNDESVRELRKTLMRHKLHKYELAQLANLVCEEIDEAKSLIPSLAKRSDEEIRAMLDDISALKKYQSNSKNCAYFYTSRKYIMDQTLPFKYVSSDEESRSLETVDVYVSDVKPEETGPIIKFIKKYCPREGILDHVKRIKKTSHDKGFTLTVLICSVESITFTDLIALIKNHNHNSILKPRIQQVCKYPAITRTQFDEWRKLWPINFIEDPKRELKFTLKEIENIEQYMERAIKLSIQAKLKGEIPIGCIMIDPKNNVILSESFDTRNSTKNPLSHAILNCINNVASLEKSNYLEKSNKIEIIQKQKKQTVDVVININSESESKTTYLCKGFDIFITHEPCIMCSMALVHSRIGRVFYGHSNKVSGGLGSCYKIHTHNSLNHHFKVFKGLLQHKIYDLSIDC